MSVDARTEQFEHVELFDKQALFTNARIDPATVPEGIFCYNIRGSDDDPGELCTLELRVGVNHAGSILTAEEIKLPESGYLNIRDEINFLGEDMTLDDFCKAYQAKTAEKSVLADLAQKKAAVRQNSPEQAAHKAARTER